MIRQIYRRVPRRTAEHDEPARPVDWEVPNTLPWEGRGPCPGTSILTRRQ